MLDCIHTLDIHIISTQKLKSEMCNKLNTLICYQIYFLYFNHRIILNFDLKQTYIVHYYLAKII